MNEKKNETNKTGAHSINNFHNLLENKNIHAIDVREVDEYRYEHIPGTMNIPLRQLTEEITNLPKNQDIFILCNTGLRTEQAVRSLHTAGLENVYAVEGGIQAWKSAGYSVKRNKGPIPIMRQVQIVAGSLALIGGLFPGLRWIAIIVGAGLIFAGVSGTCGMAAVLSKLPWNKSRSATTSKSSTKDPCDSSSS